MEGMRTTRVTAIVVAAALGGEAVAQQGFFGDPQELVQLNSTSLDVNGPISPDGLEFFINSDRPEGEGGWDIWVATRAAPDQPFGQPKKVEGLNTEFDDAAWSLSPDGLTVYFDSNRPGGRGRGDIYMAKRPELGQPFGVPIGLGEKINSDWVEWEPSLTDDGLEIYFMRAPDEGFKTRDLYVATRTDPGHPFGDPSPLAEINTPEIMDSEPVVTPDGLTLFFTSMRSGGQNNHADIWMAKRERRYDDEGHRIPFDPPINLGRPVNSHLADFASMLTRDWPASGATLYLTRAVPPGLEDWNIFQATWHSDCNGNRIDDVEEISNGDAGDVNANDIPDECEDEIPLPFLRGDSNADGNVNITDGVATLGFLFAGDQTPPCLDAADTDDSGEVNVADSIATFNWLFAGGAAPAPPGHQQCGVDPTDDRLSCANPPDCQ